MFAIHGACFYSCRCKMRLVLAYRVLSYEALFYNEHKMSKSDWNYVLIRIWEFKSVNPKISRIGRQKRNKEFFSYLTNRPIWLPTVRNDIKRFDFLFFSSKFAKLENSAKGPSAAAIRLEIWHMFNMLVWTYQTLS